VRPESGKRQFCGTASTRAKSLAAVSTLGVWEPAKLTRRLAAESLKVALSAWKKVEPPKKAAEVLRSQSPGLFPEMPWVTAADPKPVVVLVCMRAPVMHHKNQESIGRLPG
jgi:hypothetical protein